MTKVYDFVLADHEVKTLERAEIVAIAIDLMGHIVQDILCMGSMSARRGSICSLQTSSPTIGPHQSEFHTVEAKFKAISVAFVTIEEALIQYYRTKTKEQSNSGLFAGSMV